MTLRRITFTRQALGEWIRDDGNYQAIVDSKSMGNEVMMLIIDMNWDLIRHGTIYTRVIEMTKEEETYSSSP
jgi:hypothetical protein